MMLVRIKKLLLVEQILPKEEKKNKNNIPPILWALFGHHNVIVVWVIMDPNADLPMLTYFSYRDDLHTVRVLNDFLEVLPSSNSIFGNPPSFKLVGVMGCKHTGTIDGFRESPSHCHAVWI